MSDEQEEEAPLPQVETRPHHRRSLKGAVVLAVAGLLYMLFLFTRDAGFLS